MPDEPGVYLFKDAAGEVLYVGKASSLRHRVGSYFLSSTDLGPRKQPMLARIETIEVIEAEGDWEALLMEARLIKVATWDKCRGIINPIILGVEERSIRGDTDMVKPA